ncbi:hypothetical protein Hbl1158_07365 [Halobaculum sp. CBA1158]|uniref:DUF7311 family protein n=1 Tax=Halobaculum sp. CBA1158 TaxID=2904243 RepID=UPI001F3C3C86|nr:hypothetical protein [Halobaculum sp. CBA1158]UIP01157.1 hypothetical protein Hbl1158_07365 [Halobaculum sp. CBA1158]
MIRAVLAVAVAVALLAASVPAVESARADRTAAALERIPDRIDSAAAGLVASEPPVVADGPPTARRVLAVRLPSRTLARAGVDSLSICPVGADGSAALVAVVEGDRTVRRLLAGRFALPPGGVVLREPGRHRLALVPVEGPSPARSARQPTPDVRIRTLDPPAAGGGSSTGTGPPTPCDSSTASPAATRGTAPATPPVAVGRGPPPIRVPA